MKILFLVSTILVSGIFTPIHDVAIAIFHITDSKGVLEIDITFDLEDFSKTLDIETSEVNVERMQNYLVHNTSFQFNSQSAKLKIMEVKIIRDHIKVKGSLGKIKENINTVKIENTCLNNISRHSNIIQIDLNEKSKDYRMHKKRTVIKLDY